MVVYTWKDGKQLKDRNRIFDEFVKDNKNFGIISKWSKMKCLKVL